MSLCLCGICRAFYLTLVAIMLAVVALLLMWLR